MEMLRVNYFGLCKSSYFTYMEKNNTKSDVMSDVTRVMSQGSICRQNFQPYCFIVLDIFLALNYSPD